MVPSLSMRPMMILTLLALALAAVGDCFAAGEATTAEYEKKAEFLCSFARFVDWPARKFAQPDSPFVIGVIGADAISAGLTEIIQDRRIKDRQVVVKRITFKEEMTGVHLLFVSRSECGRLGAVLGEVRRENVLTVGECDGFTKAGGVINFYLIGSQVSFQINNDAAERERLKISSKLLQLSRAPGAVVQPPGSSPIAVRP